jgi:glycosyltransferase involved in cell wall biosynthesis
MDAGAKIRNDGLLRALRKDHQVDTLVPEPTPRSTVRRALDLVGSTLPDMAQRRWSPAFAASVRSALRDGGYDAVQAEGIEMARYLVGCGVPPSRRVYDAHNAEFLLQRRFSETAPSPIARIYSRLQWRRLERFEGHLVRTSRMTLAVSEHDANQLLALGSDGACVRVIPNAIDAAAFPFFFRAPQPGTTRNLLFVGKLDFRPNAEALDWFIQYVLGGLFDVRLFAVGASPPPWLVRAGQHDDRIAVTGYAVDERPYLARCAALVLPLQVGAGSRLKALIAMASGLPIVSTRVGMEGIDAEPDVHFLAAESVDDWLFQLGRLLDDVALRERLAREGRKLVEQRYDWSVIGPRVRAAYAWLDG